MMLLLLCSVVRVTGNADGGDNPKVRLVISMQPRRLLIGDDFITICWCLLTGCCGRERLVTGTGLLKYR
jgi:hypothetical protein